MSVALARKPQSLSEKVLPLLPEIRARASEIEQARSVPGDIIQKLVDIGFYRAVTPAMYGGREGDLYDWVQTTRLIAAADMATGWVAGVTGGHSFAVAYFDKRAQDDVWGNGPDTIICTSGAPVGKVRRVEGGIHLSGRYGFSSGVDHCDWAMLGFSLPEGDDSRGPGIYFALVPSTDYVIEDDWYMCGMRGTGSKTIVIDDVFIPEYRWIGPGRDLPPVNPGLHNNPMFNSQYSYFMGAPFVAVMLGGAEGALDIATTALRSRSSAMHAQRAGGYAPRQIRLAQAALKIKVAAAAMEKKLARMSSEVGAGRVLPFEEYRWMRAEDTYVTRLCRDAVDHLVNEAGAGVQASDKPLQRFWRDIHTGSEHPYLDVLSTSHVCGRLMLELPLDDIVVF